MMLLGIDPMASVAPVIAPSVDYYDTRERRPSVLEQIIEIENGSQTPSSSTSERLEQARSLSGSAKELDVPPEQRKLLDKEIKVTMKRSRYSTSDICEASERLLENKASHPSTRSLKFNINS